MDTKKIYVLAQRKKLWDDIFGDLHCLYFPDAIAFFMEGGSASLIMKRLEGD